LYPNVLTFMRSVPRRIVRIYKYDPIAHKVESFRWLIYLGVPIFVGYYATPENVSWGAKVLGVNPVSLGGITLEEVAEEQLRKKEADKKERDARIRRAEQKYREIQLRKMQEKEAKENS